MKVNFKQLWLSIFLTVAVGLLAESAYSFSYSAATKTARMTAVRDKIDGGAGAGKIQIGTTSMLTTCIEVPLDDPSGTVSGPTLTLSGFPKTVTATGTCSPAAAARVVDSDGNVVIDNLTVGTAGTNVIMDTTNVNPGQLVTVTASPTFTHG